MKLEAKQRLRLTAALGPDAVANAKQKALDAAFKKSLNYQGKTLYIKHVMPVQEHGLPQQASFEYFSTASGDQVKVDPRKLVAVQDTADLDKVLDYIDALARGARFPPVKICKEGAKTFLLDGHHTVVATLLLGLTSIDAEIIT